MNYVIEPTKTLWGKWNLSLCIDEETSLDKFINLCEVTPLMRDTAMLQIDNCLPPPKAYSLSPQYFVTYDFLFNIAYLGLVPLYFIKLLFWYLLHERTLHTSQIRVLSVHSTDQVLLYLPVFCKFQSLWVFSNPLSMPDPWLLVQASAPSFTTSAIISSSGLESNAICTSHSISKQYLEFSFAFLCIYGFPLNLYFFLRSEIMSFTSWYSSQ